MVNMFTNQQSQLISSTENLGSSATNFATTRPLPTTNPGTVPLSSSSSGPINETLTGMSRPTRVPGTYPPVWLPDSDTSSCMSCNCAFTLIKRRHHCRSCGKIFCGDCCGSKAKLLYLDNKEARVCSDCSSLIGTTLQPELHRNSSTIARLNNGRNLDSGSTTRVQGVLKTSNNSAGQECNSSSSSSEQHLSKQVMFADGVRPGTDLTEYAGSATSATPSVASPSSSFSLLSRQSNDPTSSDRKSKSRAQEGSSKTITVCDELGYLPPLVISKNSALLEGAAEPNQTASSTLIDLISQFRSVVGKQSIQTSMESRSCPLNGVVKFEEISNLVGSAGVITFLLLRDYYLRVKIANKTCCYGKNRIDSQASEDGNLELKNVDCNHTPSEFWCFASEGLYRFNQSEVLLVIDKDKDDPCIPRDAFKIFLTLHELALRRQSLESLGNLLFQDGLFGNRDTAGLLFVRPVPTHCMKNLVLPKRVFLVALILQRWEVPWSKVFPMRLLLRLGYKFNSYPYPVISFRARDPVYYEVGHTIISILGDFRNFRYSLTHVDGLRVLLDKSSRRVSVKLTQDCYQQFNKVLDSSNNEHVLAWSACPSDETAGHLVSVQNEDGHYETVEFYRTPYEEYQSDALKNQRQVLSASFVIFSGALKVDQSGQTAKISLVEDGLLIQIQSCTMTALRSAIHFMHYFDIECGK